MEAEPARLLRVSFDRVAAAIPAEMFVLPIDRLAESLSEPHALLVPASVVVPQLADGAVEVPWTLVEDQFPALAFAIPPDEVRRRFPDLRLSLPLDELIAQLPAELFRAPEGATVAGLDAFPPPFQPFSTAEEGGRTPIAPEKRGERLAATVDLFARSRTAERAEPAPEPAGSPDGALAEPGAEAVGVDDGADAAPTTAAAPAAEQAPRVVAAPAPPAAVAKADVPEAVRAEAARIAAALAPVARFEVDVLGDASVPIVGLAAPGVPVGAVAAAGRALVPLLRAGERGGHVTLRTAEAVIVTAARGAPAAVVAVGVRPGGAVAMVELLLGRLAGVLPGDDDAAPPSAALDPVETADALARAQTAAGFLGSFAPVRATVLADPGDRLRLFLFHGRDVPAAPLGDLAMTTWRRLVRGALPMALGPLRSVTFGRGAARTLVRPLRVGGSPALLAAAGAPASPGRAHLELERAAACLEAE